MQISDNLIFFIKAKKRKAIPEKVRTSACKTSIALEIKFFLPVVHQAIRLGKAFLIKLTYWPIVNNPNPRAT